MSNERRGFAGGATSTTLNGGITSGSSTITIASNTGWPDGSSGTRKFAIVIDPGLASEEKVLIASRSGTTLTVDTRGYDGTSAQAHNNGATVQHVITAIDADEANAVVNAVLGGATAKGYSYHATGAGTVGSVAPPANDRAQIADSSQSTGWSTYAIPLGRLDSTSTTTDSGSIGTSVTDLGLSVSATAKTSRRLRVTLIAPMRKTATADEVEIYITNSSNTILESARGTFTATEERTMRCEYEVVATGAVSFKGRAKCDAGTVILDVDSSTPRRAYMWIDDVGV